MMDEKHLRLFHESLAEHFNRRSEAIGLFGIGRDEHATTFWAGAAAALMLVGGHDDLAEQVAQHGVANIAVRGGIDLEHGMTRAIATRLPAPWDRR